MKRLLFISILFAITCFSCENKSPIKPDQNNKDPENPIEETFVATGWNGYFVEAMSGAYDYFVDNDKMPVYINVEGLNYGSGKALAASYKLVLKMIDEPKTWQDEEVKYNTSFSCPSNERNNTLNIEEISLTDFLAVTDLAYKYAEEKKVFPNYCTLNPEFTDVDGSVYSIKMVIDAIYVGYARIFHHYVEHGTFPEKISTWHTDYLRSVNNCPIDNPVVIGAMNEAIQGKTTDYDKAKALFEYVRDKAEWENYNNTRRGAVKTIQDKLGNCCDLSHALIAMSRAADIPARYRHAQCQYSKSVIGHVMAELYVDGRWYLCDPSNNNNTFGNHESWSHMVTFNGRYNQLPF